MNRFVLQEKAEERRKRKEWIVVQTIVLFWEKHVEKILGKGNV
jgi:hypothetical protein